MQGSSAADDDPRTFDILMKAFSLALPQARADDLEDMLLAARCFPRGERHVQLSEIRLLLRQQDWIGAVRLLKQMEMSKTLDRALLSAMLAGCLFKMRDFEWCIYAEEILREHRDGAAAAVLAKFVSVEQKVVSRDGGLQEIQRDRIVERLRISVLERSY